MTLRRGLDRAADRLSHMSRRTWIAVVTLVAVVVLALVLSSVLDEPLRRTVERQMNARLTGYAVRIERLSFHPVGLSLTLYGLVFTQTAHPDPPVARIPRLDASVEWKALLHGRLVADFALDRPRLHLDLQHLRAEAEDQEPVTQKGWQEAFQAIYPLKIDEFRVRDGAVTYQDAPPSEPLELTAVNLVAEDIRNVRSHAGDYPSPVHLEAVVFGTGKVVIDGHADFLAIPHPGIKASVELRDIDLDHFKAVTSRFHVAVRNGVLSAKGLVEYAPGIEVVDLERAVIEKVAVEYTSVPASTGAVGRAASKAARGAQEVSDEPGLVLRAREVKVLNSTVGFVDRAVSPPYRAFLTDMDLTITGFSNHQAEGPTRARLTGKFMGSGATLITATFRPDKSGPDFDVHAQVEHTDMRTMNEMLRSYGKLDVAAGDFSVYSELAVRNQRVEGYVKPLFRDVNVYDPRQDRDKGFFQKLYEKTVEGVSRILKNVPRKEVATKTTISGPLENPSTNLVEILTRLLQNAFFKAILPGFDREVVGLRARPARPAS